MIVIIGVIASIVGLLGYSLIPQERFENENYLSSIVNFYMVVCFALFLHTYTRFFEMNYMFLEVFFGFSITVAAIYLLWNVVGFNKEIDKQFDFFRLKNGVLYASLAWLMGKEFAFIDSSTIFLPGLILFPLFFVLLYAFLVMKEMKLQFFYENSTIFSNSFLLILLSGLAVISMGYTPGAQGPIELVAVLVALYVIAIMFRAAKPFLS
ncbi:MAG: hypothetical protein ACLFVI_05030 [Archaeoglobaceae archaeon]